MNEKEYVIEIFDESDYHYKTYTTTDFSIDGETIENRDRRVIKEYIERLLKNLN